MMVYVLTKEDLSNLGGPMGTEFTRITMIKVFSDLDKAKNHAERITRGVKKIDWLQRSRTEWYSGDLGNCDYTIQQMRIL